MKKNSNKKFLFRIITFLVICVVSYRITTNIFGARSYSFDFDSCLSNAMQNTIKSSVQSLPVQSLSEIAHHIKNTYKAVNTIALQRCGNNTLYIMCKSHQPYLLLVDHGLLLKNGSIIEKACFSMPALKDLPQISFEKENKTVSSEFITWLLSLDKSIIENYIISWVDDFEIYLTAKQSPITMVCSVNSVLKKDIREKCQQIVEEKSKMAQGTAHPTFYTADIRFEKQIIICSQKGGACHG